jgi:hypothetical protein
MACPAVQSKPIWMASNQHMHVPCKLCRSGRDHLELLQCNAHYPGRKHFVVSCAQRLPCCSVTSNMTCTHHRGARALNCYAAMTKHPFPPVCAAGPLQQVHSIYSRLQRRTPGPHPTDRAGNLGGVAACLVPLALNVVLPDNLATDCS